MWGQVRWALNSVGEIRIIPTRVGTSRASASIPGNVKDHPHACGDKVSLEAFVCVPVGSSPRVWGQVASSNHEFLDFRIIPTRVGTSILKLELVLCARDHPHACGDKYT